MGMTRRRLYKQERRAPRKKGVIGQLAPVDCSDATQPEVVSAIAFICDDLGIRVGRGGEYDALRDVYTVVAKVLDGSKEHGVWTGKVRDVKIPGRQVADAIVYTRGLALGRVDVTSLVLAGRLAEARERLGGGRYDRPMSWASA